MPVDMNNFQLRYPIGFSSFDPEHVRLQECRGPSGELQLFFHDGRQYSPIGPVDPRGTRTCPTPSASVRLSRCSHNHHTHHQQILDGSDHLSIVLFDFKNLSLNVSQDRSGKIYICFLPSAAEICFPDYRAGTTCEIAQKLGLKTLDDHVDSDRKIQMSQDELASLFSSIEITDTSQIPIGSS